MLKITEATPNVDNLEFILTLSTKFYMHFVPYKEYIYKCESVAEYNDLDSLFKERGSEITEDKFEWLKRQVCEESDFLLHVSKCISKEYFKRIKNLKAEWKEYTRILPGSPVYMRAEQLARVAEVANFIPNTISRNLFLMMYYCHNPSDLTELPVKPTLLNNPYIKLLKGFINENRNNPTDINWKSFFTKRFWNKIDPERLLTFSYTGAGCAYITWPNGWRCYCEVNNTGVYPLDYCFNNFRYNQEEDIFFDEEEEEEYNEDDYDDDDNDDGGLIKDYGTDALKYLTFKSLPTDTEKSNGNKLYLGVELEVVVRSSYDKYDVAEKMDNDLYDFIIMCNDGSIDGDGFEIISAPATHNYHLTAWDKFFNNGAKYVRGWKEKSCGMHVHLSRNAFENKYHLMKFVTFINHRRNEDFITNVAGRSANTYCAIKHKNYNKRALEFNNRYQAVNLENRNTIEVRIFQSNVAKKGFFKNLEFCVALFEYTKHCSIFGASTAHHMTIDSHRNKSRKKHKENLYRSLIWDDFTRWCGTLANRKRYKYLTDWMVVNGYIKNIKKEKPSTNNTEVTNGEDQQCA